MTKCWICGSDLTFRNDFTFEEVYGFGEGQATLLTCNKCDAFTWVPVGDEEKFECPNFWR